MVAALVSLLLLGIPANTFADEPVTIPVILSLTGSAAFFGNDEKQILSVLQTQTNREGGIGGRQLAFDFEDDQSSPVVAVQLANKIVQSKSPVVLGPTIFASCAAAEPVIGEHAVTYCFSPAGKPPAGGYVFSAGVSSDDISLAATRYFRDLGIRRLGEIAITDATGQDGERTLAAALQAPANHDMVLVATEHVAPADLSASAQFTRLAAAQAQVCFCWATGTGLGTLLHSYADAGLKMPVLTSTGNMTYAQMDQYASFGVKTLYFVAFPYFAPQSAPPALKGVIQSFLRASAAAAIRPDSAAGDVWDPASIVIAALRHLGPTATAAQVRDYIAGQRSYPGIDGVYDFVAVPQRGLDERYATIVRWDPPSKSWVAASAPKR